MILRHASGMGLWLLIIGMSATEASAQTWADKMFESRSHDFGTVARNTKLEHSFVIKNTLNRRVHIASATPSCSVCTLAKPEKAWLEPGESTVLKAVIDTLTVERRKDVSITVVFDQPSYAQSRLLLTCFVRTDIVFSQNQVSFGTTRRGSEVTKTITVEYAGNNDWKIDGVTCPNSALQVEIEETHRGRGLVGYRVKVTLRPDAPPGAIHERIVLGVNDAYNDGIDIGVSGNVHADVSLSASSLDIGNVAPGSTTTKQVLVRGIKPFKIVSISGPEGLIEFDMSDETKPLHVLTVKLKAGEKPGLLSQDFQITTDMDGEPPLKLTVSAKLVDAKAIAN